MSTERLESIMQDILIQLEMRMDESNKLLRDIHYELVHLRKEFNLGDKLSAVNYLSRQLDLIELAVTHVDDNTKEILACVQTNDMGDVEQSQTQVL
ncbi:hypothetical protein [Aeromonas sp. 62-46]|uniref:hypothetical protein n=1 Tax=Aeromonas TaxID=642 RepID=UPI0009269AB7|nr:hypothetical protein [Aeromonas sp. 62-46]OJW67498.1 MAG: hypothetical protein BGO64_14235 [Aeromonas sp. 62-46]